MEENFILLRRKIIEDFHFIFQLKTAVSEKMLRATGRVVGIIKRNWRPYCGMLSKSDIKEVSKALASTVGNNTH